MSRRSGALLLLCLLSLGGTVSGETELCACFFNVADEGDCLVYVPSVSGSGVSKYSLGNSSCLTVLGINEKILPDRTLWRLCPTFEATNDLETKYIVNVDEAVNRVRLEGEEPVSQTIMAEFEDRGLFVKDSDGIYVLPEVLVDPSQQSLPTNCTLSPDFCWNIVKVDFTGRRGKWIRLCNQFHIDQTKALFDEQEKAREMLCSSSQEICEPLSSEIQADKAAASSCSAFAASVAEDQLPPCNKTTNTQNLPSGARAMFTGTAGLAASFLLWLVQ